ncbi:MAG: hypothetical protein ACREMU_04970 [Gemmatimonadaceae bacterium]
MNDGTNDSARTLLRHTVATLWYRAEKTLRGAPPDFATFRVGPSSRTPGEILAHLGDLIDWGISMARGAQKWSQIPPSDWDADGERLHRALVAFDELLGSDAPVKWPLEKLFQGPIADALTHVGQLNMLHRLAGAPVRGENYAKAEIAAGALPRELTGKRSEFD